MSKAIKEQIPIIVGVTGHRDIVEEDKEAIRHCVRNSLREILQMCNCEKSKVPVIMLNGFAQGADMLCAEVAFDLGIPVYAVLPCGEDEYAKSFDNAEDKAKLHGFLAKAQRQIIAPDIEQNRERMNIDEDSYRYRQLGIYIAAQSHVLIALWDGGAPKTKYGCGTVEVIQFALEHNFLNKDWLFSQGKTNNSAVVWINSRRQKNPEPAKPIKSIWITSSILESSKGIKKEQETNSNDEFEDAVNKALNSIAADESSPKSAHYVTSSKPPQFLKQIVAQISKYNKQNAPNGDSGEV